MNTNRIFHHFRDLTKMVSSKLELVSTFFDHLVQANEMVPNRGSRLNPVSLGALHLRVKN